MARAEQLDCKYLSVPPKAKKIYKTLHKRHMRRLAKKVNLPNPQYNRYDGYAN